MSPPIEVLVHVSGPSRGVDDVRYRKEAQSLLAFQARSKHVLLSANDDDHSQVSQQNVNPPVGGRRTPGPKEIPLLIEKGKSSLRAQAEVTTPGPGTHAALSALETPGLWGTRPAQGPLIGIRSGIKAQSKLLIERTPVIERPHTAPVADASCPVPPQLRRTQSDSWQTPPSVVPDSQPTPSSGNTAHVSSSPLLKRPFQASSSSPSQHVNITRGKRPHLETEKPTRRTTQDLQSDRTIPEPSSPVPVEQASDAPISETLPIEIHPPRPRPSVAAFVTHLTPRLEAVSSSIARYYNPTSQFRTLDPLERGHWLVSLTTWDSALKARFWKFLTQFVGKGEAGWGVWCIRELEAAKPNSGSSKENKDPETLHEVVRVYCWGEIVGSIWLLLFVASERKIKRSGALWIDAEGAVVVVMREDIVGTHGSLQYKYGKGKGAQTEGSV